jgi:flagellar hook-associated protein 1 FlgK
MTISSLLNIGQRALMANYAALQVTGNNVANANTPGYSRQRVELATAFSQQTGAGFFGKGVDVATVTRAHSDFLTREAATSASLAAADEARSSQLQMLENVFRTGEDGLGYSAQQLFNAFVDISNKPQDASARQVALARVGDLAARFRAASDQLDAQQAGIAQDLRTAVESINALTTRIAALNANIANAQGSGHAPNDLLDQRDTAIADLAKIAQVTTVAAADGTVGVFLGGAQRLVLGGESTPLVALPDAFDPAKVQIGVSEGGTTRAFPDGFIAGGSVCGLLRVQNHDLPDARGLLGQLASAIAGAVNQQQALGVDLGQPPGPGAPLLSVGAATVAPSSNNAMAGGVPVASYATARGFASRASRSPSSRPASCSRATTSSSPTRRCPPAAIG